MIDQTMKIGLVCSFLLLITTNLLGQFRIPRFDFDKIKGVDSVVVYIKFNEDSSKWVYYYQNDRKTKANFFRAGGLSSYSLFQYDDKRQLCFEIEYRKSARLDSDNSDSVEFWNPDNYLLTIKKFSGLQLAEEKICNVNHSDTTVNLIESYTYDKQGRILNEVARFVIADDEGSFKSDYVDSSDLGYKNTNIGSRITYKYHLGKTEVLYTVKGVVTGKEIVIFDNENRVTSIKQFSPKNILLSQKIAKYDEKGRLKSINWATYSSMSLLGDSDYEIIGEGIETIMYDSVGRPSVTLTSLPGGSKTKIEYKYY